MKLLNKEGQKSYHEWVKKVKNGELNRTPTPIELLDDGATSFYFPTKEKLPDIDDSADKYMFIKLLLPIIEELESADFEKSNFPLVYDTLALLHFTHIAPPEPKEISGMEFYCYDPSSQRRYRHRILGPMTLFRSSKTDVKPFYRTPIYQMGEYESNIGSRQQIAGNPNLLSVVKAIYTSKDNGQLLTGITTTETFSRKGSKNKKIGKPGTLRRFGQVTNQLARVYDIYDAKPDAFVAVLPDEFRKWIDQ